MADSPDLMHVATLGGRVAAGRSVPYRVHPGELLQRYGMWVHRCVSLNAAAAASVPCRLYMVDPTGSMERAGARRPDRKAADVLAGRADVDPSPSVKAAIRGHEDELVEITDHPILDLLQNVNRWAEGYGYRESLYSDLQIYGRAFTLVVGNQEPEQLWRMAPHKMRVIPDMAEFVGGFEYGDGTSRTTYEPEDVLWFRLYDPENPWEGLGPLEAWLRTVDAMHHIAAFQDELFRRGGAPDYIVKSNRDLGENQKRAFRREWRKLFGRLFKRTETVGFIGGEGVDLTRLTDSPRELEFTESQNQIRDMIGQAFGVPKPLLTADDVNRSNAKEAGDAHMRLTIWPMVQRVEDVLNEQLVSRWDERLFLMHENPIRADQATEIADRESKLRSGWTVNEVRASCGAEALDEEYADVPMVGAGIVPLEMLAEGPDDADDDDGPDDEPGPDDGPDAESEDDDDMAELRGFRLVHPAVLNGSCGCSGPKLQSQREMWRKAEQSDKPEEIDGPASRLTRDLRSLLTGWTARAASRADGPTTLPSLDVVLPDAERGRMVDEAAAAAEPHVAASTQTAGQKALAEVGADVSFDIDAEAVRAFIRNEAFTIARNTEDAFRKAIQPLVLEAFQTGMTPAQLKELIEAETDRMGWRAERVATTEIGHVATAAREEAWKTTGLDLRKVWVLSADACPLCEAMAAEFNAEPRPLGYKLREAGSGSTFTYVAESGNERTISIDYRDISGGDAHPYCRCTIVAEEA